MAEIVRGEKKKKFWLDAVQMMIIPVVWLNSKAC